MTSRICPGSIMIALLIAASGFAQTVDPLTGEVIAPVEVSATADLTEVNELVRARDYAGAEALLASLQKEHPDDFRVLLMRGELLLALQKPAEALASLELAAKVDGTAPRLHFQLGTARQLMGELDGALAAFQSEIEINEEPTIKIMAHLNRMVIYREKRKWSEAAAEMAAVLEIQPDRANDYGELALLQLSAGKSRQAAATLDAGAEHGFSSAQHHYDVAARFLEESELESAIAQFQKALAIQPEMARAERELGRALNAAGRLDEALIHLERYLELVPSAGDRARVEGWIEKLRGT